jgi:hypothetical protein
VDIPNKKALAVSGVVAGVCLIFGSLAGHQGIAVGAVMCLLFGVWFVLIEVKGSDLVEVPFGDSDNLHWWDEWYIRKVVNEAFLYLRQNDLSPPRVCPVLNVGDYERWPGGNVQCSGYTGNTPDYSHLTTKTKRSRPGVAHAYWCCYLHRTICRVATEKNFPLNDPRLAGAVWIIDGYFQYAFGEIFIGHPESRSAVAQWIAALLSVRLTCGQRFTDGAIAHTALDIGQYPRLDSNTNDLSPWFWGYLKNNMFRIRPTGNIEKLEQATAILKDRGLIE